MTDTKAVGVAVSESLKIGMFPASGGVFAQDLGGKRCAIGALMLCFSCFGNLHRCGQQATDSMSSYMFGKASDSNYCADNEHIS